LHEYVSRRFAAGPQAAPVLYGTGEPGLLPYFARS
jgi:hypothetical protein